MIAQISNKLYLKIKMKVRSTFKLVKIEKLLTLPGEFYGQPHQAFLGRST